MWINSGDLDEMTQEVVLMSLVYTEAVERQEVRILITLHSCRRLMSWMVFKFTLLFQDLALLLLRITQLVSVDLFFYSL